MHEAKWQPFVIGDLFFIVSGEDVDKRSMVTGNTPFVGSASTGNGVTAFTGTVNGSLDRLFLGVNRNGSVGEAYVHPYKCLCSGDVRRLHLQNGRDGESILQFCAVAVRKQKEKYSYGCKFGTERMRRQKIMLPVAEDGSPDWDFMDACVTSVKERLLARWKRHATERFAGLEEREIPRLEEKEWMAFLIGALFSIKRPPARGGLAEGNTPFVASGSTNNGVAKFCDPGTNAVLDNAGCITVSPVDGSAFYQPFPFLGRGGAGSSILMLYRQNFSLYAGLFIAKMVTHACSSKFSYGHMGNEASMKRERIMLPTDSSGEPDWNYMEQYVKNMMAKKLRQYLSFLEARKPAEGTSDAPAGDGGSRAA